MKKKSFLQKLLLALTLLSFTSLFSDEKCSHSCALSVTPLYWTLRESGADDWAQNFVGTDIDVLAVPFKWDPGIRVGLQYLPHPCCWETEFSYTWFSTTGKESLHSSGQITSAFIGNFYIDNLDGAKDAGPTYRDANIQWKVHFSMFDWTCSRSFSLHPSLSVKPSIGLKGGWIHQSIYSQWYHPNISGFTFATENLKNNYWGIGPSIGALTRWKINRCFALFGDFSGALMYGHWSFKDIYQNNAPFTVNASNPSISGGSSMLRAYAGIDYKTKCFSVELGYEAQFWFNQLRFYSFNLGQLDHLLTLQGATLNIRYTF